LLSSYAVFAGFAAALRRSAQRRFNASEIRFLPSAESRRLPPARRPEDFPGGLPRLLAVVPPATSKARACFKLAI